MYFSSLVSSWEIYLPWSYLKSHYVRKSEFLEIKHFSLLPPFKIENSKIAEIVFKHWSLVTPWAIFHCEIICGWVFYLVMLVNILLKPAPAIGEWLEFCKIPSFWGSGPLKIFYMQPSKESEEPCWVWVDALFYMNRR